MLWQYGNRYQFTFYQVTLSSSMPVVLKLTDMGFSNCEIQRQALLPNQKIKLNLQKYINTRKVTFIQNN